MIKTRGKGLGLVLAGMLALSACDETVTSPRPESRATPAPTKIAPHKEVQPSPRSVELADHYERVQAQLLTRGLLRQDGGGPDTPYGQRDVVRNFVQIAAFSELTLDGDAFTADGSANPIRHWTKPVRVMLDFGETANAALQADIRDTVERYIKRLSRLTGRAIFLVEEGPDFTVAVLNVDELGRYEANIQRQFPDVSAALANQMVDLPRAENCVVYTFAQQEQPNRIHSAVALIRAEHPKLLRDKCLHEEIAQGLGLINDSPAARPSIFNDDDEFALLTSHDELLLRMLYDPRMPLGAGPEEARSAAQTIASELLGNES